MTALVFEGPAPDWNSGLDLAVTLAVFEFDAALFINSDIPSHPHWDFLLASACVSIYVKNTFATSWTGAEVVSGEEWTRHLQSYQNTIPM